MHTGTIPVALYRLRMEIHCHTILLTGAFENVTSRPDLVTALGSALGEDLEFPLTCHHLGIDTLDIQAGLKTQVQVLVHNLASVRIARPHRSVIRALRSRETVLREAQRQVCFRINQSVFLFQTEPEIVV